MGATNVIADKIRKLMAHEQSCRAVGSIAEAEAFAAKIQSLMLEYKLSMSDVDLKADPIGHGAADAAKPGRQAQEWSALLAVAAARSCLCDAVSVGGTNAVIFIGRGADRKMALSIWHFLTGQALDLAKADLPKIAKRSRMHPLRARSRYLKGFATAIVLRLVREREKTAAASGLPGIHLLNREQRLRDSYKANALRTREVNVAKVRDSLAFRAGFVRGADSPLRKQHTLEAAQ